MTDLIAFITARLAEVEAHARKDLYLIDQATPLEQWTSHYGYNLPYSLLGEDGSIARVTSSYGRPLADGEPDQHQADAMLVARLVRGSRREAERALRDIEAKRALLALHDLRREASEFEGRANTIVWCATCNEPDFCPAVKLLALPYSDHPDYREEWRP